jgi:translation initiation factor 5
LIGETAPARLSAASAAALPAFKAFVDGKANGAAASTAAAQIALLVGVERALGVTAVPSRAKEAALVLKELYEGDAVDEEILVGWSAKNDAGAVLEIPQEAAEEVRKGAAPFISWLEEAEGSDSDDDDE